MSTSGTTPIANDELFTVPLDAGSSDTDTAALSPVDAASAEAAAGAGPRTRWAAIVWGLVLAFLAGSALSVLLSPQRRIELAEWITSLEPTTIALYGALAIGALVLLASLVGLLRRAQRALAARRNSAQ